MRPQLLLSALLSLLSIPALSQGVVPADTWMRYRDPGQAGWSMEKLGEAEAYWQSTDSAAWMVVENGHVVVAWGDVDRRFMCHSVRKSFLSALYGIHVDAGTIDTDKTMAELGIDDQPQLTEVEKTARVRDLLAARSGVYRLAAYEPPQNPKPPRGSHEPGTNWVYNNWDFNTLCTIFEQETGKKVFEEFAAGIAAPLGMQDYRIRDGYYHYELDKSIHPAYPFRLSARDSARFGLLFLYGGQWDGQRILSNEWVLTSTSAHSDLSPGGYGYMWWISGDARVAETGMYSAQGVGGQTIAVLPNSGLVIVNRTNTYMGNDVGEEQRLHLTDLILKARTNASSGEIDVVPLEPQASSLAPASAPEALEIEALEEFVGVYPMPGGSDEIEVRLEDGTFLIDTSFAGVFGAVPVTDDTFFVEDVRTHLLFEEKAQGKRGRLVWEWGMLRQLGGQLESEDLDGAFETVERMLELFPMSSLAHLAMAWMMEQSGDPAIARELCEEALKLDPGNRDARTLLNDLKAR